MTDKYDLIFIGDTISAMLSLPAVSRIMHHIFDRSISFVAWHC